MHALSRTQTRLPFPTLLQDYYSVWGSSQLRKVLCDLNSWYRRAYAPEGVVRLRAELVAVS